MRERMPGYGPWLALAALVSVGAWHWARIEDPQMPLLEVGLMIVIAIAPTVAAQLFGRVAGLVTLLVAIPVAIGMTTGMWPGSSGHHRYPAAVVIGINHGAHDWFNATTPFDYGRFRAVDGDARLLFMAIVAALAWTVVLRRWTLISIALGLVLFAFPSTVLDLGHPWLRAAWFLGAALITLRLVPRRPLSGGGSSQAWALGTAVVVLGLVVSALPGVNKAAFMSWHTWNPLAAAAAPRNLSYVWNQSYKPLHWKGKPTQVLEVWSPHAAYWKVATLESFRKGAWAESAFPVKEGLSSAGQGSVTVPESALPGAARFPNAKDLSTVRVKVLALADSHLVSAAQPVKWSGPDNVPFTLRTDGTAEADHDIPRNATYSSVVFLAHPTKAELQRSGRRFPKAVQRDMSLGGQLIPSWPQRQAPAPPAGIDPALVAAANQVWHRSEADTETNEWAAVVDVEAYFRGEPFSYDLTPQYSNGSPVLAQFMLRVHRGYCQMFSGAMALTLRLHGIPARVAVGFTTGTRGSEVGAPYVITDRNAHSWVEAYFPGFGWQPSDPTPTRHLPDGASASNPKFVKAVQQAAIAPGADPRAIGTPHGLLKQSGAPSGASPIPGGPKGHDLGAQALGAVPVTTGSKGGHGFFAAAIGLAVVLLALMAIVKFVAVRWRYLRRGPRAQASAAYRELSTFVGDQGIADSPERTFEDLSSELKRVFGVDASAFAEHASRARYGPEAKAEPAGKALRQDMRGLKRSIRSQLSVGDRVRGALRIRSALAQITSLD